MLEGWTIHLIYGAIGAIVLAVLLIVAFIKKGQYEEEVKGRIMAVIKRPTGWPLKRVVKVMPDGWARVERGDYKLAEELKGKNPSDITDEERLNVLGERKTFPWAYEWDWYPASPFMGLVRLRVPIRKQEWWENNPNPIAPPGEKIALTAVDAQAHTREMDAMNVAIRIQESDARQKQLMEAISNQPNKMILYVMIGIAIVLGVIGLVPNLSLG